MNESIVIVFASLIVIAFLFRSVRRAISSIISNYCGNIESEISSSYLEREQVKKELDEILEKNKTIEGEVEDLLDIARLEAKLISNKKQKLLESHIAQQLTREKQKIQSNKLAAIQEIKERVIAISTDYSYKLTTSKLHDRSMQAKVINFAIEQMPNKVH